MEARAVINLKEGIIELQGPVDFVRHYLDMYRIKGPRSSPKLAAVAPETKTGLRRRTKAAPGARAGKKKRVSSTGVIRSDLEAGFFSEARSIREVKQRLNEAGLTLTDTAVRAALNRLSLGGLLDAVRKGRSVRYQRRAQL